MGKKYSIRERQETRLEKMNRQLTWKKVMMIGLTLGLILGGVAYGTLWVLGNQLKAEGYRQAFESKFIDFKPELQTNSIPMGSCELIDGDCELQPAYGRNHYQPTITSEHAVYSTDWAGGELKVVDN